MRASGHIEHTPDLFDGRTFESIDEGLAYIGEIGFDEMRARGVRVADELPPETRLRWVLVRCAAGDRSLHRHGPEPPGLCSGRRRGPNPRYGQRPIFVGEGDIDAAREIVDKVEDAELFLHAGDQHYFADSSLPSYDADGDRATHHQSAWVHGSRLIHAGVLA